MPELSGEVLRIMLETNHLPTTFSLWNAAFSILVKTRTGSFVAADVIIDLCDFFLCCKRKKSMPDANLFNLVLGSSVEFISPLRALQVFEKMTATGVIGDVNSVVWISRVFENNGLREDLKKLKPFIDAQYSPLLNHYYQHFYDCLLSLHFKFNDLDAASDLVAGLYRRSMSLPSQSPVPKTVLYFGSENLRKQTKLLIDLASLPNYLPLGLENTVSFVDLKEGKILPSYKAIGKLILGYVRERKVGNLSKLLVGIHQEVGSSSDFNLGIEIVGSCVELGWLGMAHDILDDLESSGISFPNSTYSSLLKAYKERNMFGEARVLIRQMKDRGLVNLPDEEAISLFLSLEEQLVSSALTKLLEEESREEGDQENYMTHEFNFSIFFFCKGGMMEDAIQTYRKMQERKVQPNVQTFGHLVNGFSSREMYREITFLWGEIKRKIQDGVLSPDKDLFASLMWNFIRGGYFERAMEIANCMEESLMYIDKWRFRREFLKLHRNLYRNLTLSNVRTDAQSKRLEHVRAFKKWVGVARAKRIRSRG